MNDTPRVTVPVEPEYTATEYLRLIAEGWEVVESTGSQMTIQNPEDDGPQELVIDVDLLSAAPAPEGVAKHYGDPCVKCGVGHDDVPPGPCRGDGITISRERANALLGYLKNGRGPAGWPTTLWCEVQAFIKNIESALATREEAPAETGENWPTLADLHTIKGWLYGLSTAPDLTDVVADGGVSVGDCYQQEARDFAGRIERIINSLRAQPPAREDAQPVAWAIFWRHAMTLHPTLEDAETARKGVPHDIVPLYTHPAPDALRVAVEALEKIRDRTKNSDCFSDIGFAFDTADQALDALQAEQGAK